MRPFRMLSILVALAVSAGCGGGGDGESDDGASTPATAAATTVPVLSTVGGTTVPPSNLTLRITDVRLLNSEESDSGMRVLLPAGVTTASVTLTGLPSPNNVVLVCQARALDTRLSGATCRPPANAEAVTVTLGAAASGVEIIQVGAAAPGPGGNTVAVNDVTVRYAASSRELHMRLAQVASERPTIALTPASTDGAYRALLSWTVIPVFGGTPSTGQLELLQGGNVVSQAQAGADVRLNGNLSPPVGDVALRVQNTGTAALLTPKLALLLP